MSSKDWGPMFDLNSSARRRTLPLAVSFVALVCAAPAFGQGDQTVAAERKDDRPKVAATKPTSPNATINLVNLLVKQGVLTQEQAVALIKQADDEAYVSRQAAKDANTKADEANKNASAAAAAANPPGTRHVTYVPEVVKRQLREEIRNEVMAKAEKENWASPGKYPEWAQRIRFYGDLRARYEGDFFPSGNGPFVNFNGINTGSPYNLDSTSYWPAYNTTEDRNRARLRARLGADIDLLYGFTAGIRIATGENSSPVSTNQTFGSSSSGGNFSKYAIWLDRGFINYTGWSGDFSASIGRFDNPFWSPIDLMWYKDLGFDGLAVQVKREMAPGFTPFAVAGAFPVYNTDLNAGTNFDDGSGNNMPVKLGSQDRWLLGGQFGFAQRFAPESSFRVAAAYYDFTNVKGRLSSACDVESSSDVCDTDILRPAFAQKGNTYMALRNIPTVWGTTTLTPYQYYGLASDFRPVVGTAQLDIGEFHPIHVILDGEYVWNTAFNKSAVAAIAVNNFSGSTDGLTGTYGGGNQGWMTRLTVGNKEVRHLWDWNVHAGYKYLESDATIDAFVDSDFGLGGTNLKGYFVGGNLGLSENVWATLRWMSATGITGAPYAVDIVQLDLNSRF